MVGEMQGLIAALVAYIFVCIIFPHLVKNRSQFYIAFGMVLLVIAFGGAGFLVGGAGGTFLDFIALTLALCAFVVLVMASGGLSLGELTGEMRQGFEVLWRGQGPPNVIVPLKGEQPKGVREKEEPAAPPRINLTDTSSPPASPPASPPSAAPRPAPAPKIPKPAQDTGIPLE